MGAVSGDVAGVGAEVGAGSEVGAEGEAEVFGMEVICETNQGSIQEHGDADDAMHKATRGRWYAKPVVRSGTKNKDSASSDPVMLEGMFA